MALSGITDAMVEGKPARLLTLTLPARIEVNGRMVVPTGPAAYRYMAAAFNRFMTGARRRWRFTYFRVVEEQGRGAPHYHLVVIGWSFMAQGELSRLAVSAGLGPVVDVRLVRSARGAARYVTKYVTKDAGAVVPDRMRFFTRSQSFGAEARADYIADKAARSVGWSHAYLREGESAGHVMAELQALGYEVDVGE